MRAAPTLPTLRELMAVCAQRLMALSARIELADDTQHCPLHGRRLREPPPAHRDSFPLGRAGSDAEAIDGRGMHMDPERLKLMYRRWLDEVWGNGKYEVDDELLAEDLVDHNRLPGQPAGRAGDVWAAKAIRKAFPDLEFTIDLIISDGEYVVGRWTMTGTHTGVIDFMNLPPTGRPVTMTGQEIYRAEGGTFVELWHQEDVPSMLSQLGLDPPPAIARMAAKRSARKYRREQKSAGGPGGPQPSS